MSTSERAGKRSRTRAAAQTQREQREQQQETRRVGRRRLWRAVGAFVAVAVLVGAVAAAYFSPLMSVREVTVTGTGSGTVSTDEVLAVAEVPQGEPLLQVDTGVIAQRVARIPGVQSARVDRNYPSTILIDVVERRPLVLIDAADGTVGVMDHLGVVYLEFDSREAMGAAAAGPVVYRDLPVLEVSRPGPQDPTTKAAVEMVAGLPDWLRRDVQSVSASSPADLTLHLTKSRTVVWGDSERGEDKAEALKHVLKLNAKSFNVSSPDYPAVR
ncbi:cell division protein FtsQ/DivIB [Gordonia phosphorivorans]|uniref:Cell division protein FtsQ/DivIB n=1 Tax=Gordonia phosphorivorans TaxID=1056982 RepID=A0ABV6H4J5_9ACTN